MLFGFRASVDERRLMGMAGVLVCGVELAEGKIIHQVSRPISTGQLHALLRFHLQPINVVVFNGALGPEGQGDLILRSASRLDAFSGYPIQPWLPGNALGRTTGTPEGCSTRSSRTKVNASQISYAHSR